MRKLSLVKFARIRSHQVENKRIERRSNMRSNTALSLKVNPIRNRTYEKSFVNVSTTRNRLPQELKLIQNTQDFKTRVKCELLQGKLNFHE